MACKTLLHFEELIASPSVYDGYCSPKYSILTWVIRLRTLHKPTNNWTNKCKKSTAQPFFNEPYIWYGAATDMAVALVTDFPYERIQHPHFFFLRGFAQNALLETVISFFGRSVAALLLASLPCCCCRSVKREAFSVAGWRLALLLRVPPLSLCFSCLFLSRSCGGSGNELASHRHTLIKVHIWGLNIKSVYKTGFKHDLAVSQFCQTQSSSPTCYEYAEKTKSRTRLTPFSREILYVMLKNVEIKQQCLVSISYFWHLFHNIMFQYSLRFTSAASIKVSSVGYAFIALNFSLGTPPLPMNAESALG